MLTDVSQGPAITNYLRYVLIAGVAVGVISQKK